tara:strand:- start:1749 stop:2687 length:939 start_codon:yes stop_codon:yes gene_type:complete
MHNTHRTKVLIIGSGPAGYTAAIYAARANLEPILVQGLEPGGQLTITTDVENYPGFSDVIQGPWLMDQMREQAEKVGTKLVSDLIQSVDFSKRPFNCIADSGDLFIGETIIICTGAQAKWLGISTEKKYMGFGVSACATCDGFFYKDKNVAVIGGGNTAVEEALYLTNHAKKVTLIHRRNSLKAEKILQDRLFANNKIEVVWNHILEEIKGKKQSKSVNSILIKSTETGKIQDLNIEGVFIAIGHRPNTDIFRGHLEMDDEGYILTSPDSTATSVPGIFAAGDVQDKIYRQAVTAAGTGCMSALEAEKFYSG